MTAEIETLRQLLLGPVWNGNMTGRSALDKLVEAGFAERWAGFYFLSSRGVQLCLTLGLLLPDTAIRATFSK